ncbi:MAG: rhodanese-like domain-containing protein [Crocinitomicaceae bacterium]
MRNISGDELRQIRTAEDAVVLDVRTPGEVHEGMIEGAINIDLMNQYFQDRVEELDRNKHYLMVCRSGGRSAQAGMYMESIGFEHVYNLEGGMMDWDGEVVRP